MLVFLRWQIFNPDSKVFYLNFSVIKKTFTELFLNSEPNDIDEENNYH